MNEEVFYRVKFTSAGELRKEMIMNELRKGFSLKKVLVLEGGSFLVSFLLWMPGMVQRVEKITVFSLFRIPLFILAIHLWCVLCKVLTVVLGTRYSKDVEQGTDLQIWFLTDRFRDKGLTSIREFSYDEISHVRETRVSFWIEYHNKLNLVLLKKNFLEGDVASFKAFLKNPGQRFNFSKTIMVDEDRSIQSKAVFQVGAVLDEEVYVRNGVLEQSWAMENMDARIFLGCYLGICLMILPFLAIGILSRILLDGSGNKILTWVVSGLVLLLAIGAACASAWKKRGVNYAAYRMTAGKAYQQMVGSGALPQPMSYNFFVDSFEATQGKNRWVYDYSAICRMYKTQWYLILLVGDTVTALAFTIDKRSMGEDCEQLMGFLMEKSGQEWINSPV